MEYIPFGRTGLDNLLQKEPHRVESLPFGAILLDREGKILKYNKTEGMIAGRDPSEAVGKNFFNDLAPCAKGKRFHGEFLKFRTTGSVHTMFDYQFDYKMKLARVRIQMKSSEDGQSCWLFIKRLEIED
jgi:photoactive yellow protein